MAAIAGRDLNLAVNLPLSAFGAAALAYLYWCRTGPAAQLSRFAARQARPPILLDEASETVFVLDRREGWGTAPLAWQLDLTPGTDVRDVAHAVHTGQMRAEDAPYELYRFTPLLPWVVHVCGNMPGADPRPRRVSNATARNILAMVQQARVVGHVGDPPDGDGPRATPWPGKAKTSATPPAKGPFTTVRRAG